MFESHYIVCLGFAKARTREFPIDFSAYGVLLKKLFKPCTRRLFQTFCQKVAGAWCLRFVVACSEFARKQQDGHMKERINRSIKLPMFPLILILAGW